MRSAVTAVAGILLLPVAGQSAEPTPDAVSFFETRIRPVLAEHCFSCHSTRARKLKGGLLLDSRAGLLKGGETGPVVVPGQPARSRLVEAVRYQDVDLRMPPRGKLPDAAVADLTRWVTLGVPWPEEQATSKAAAGEAFDLARRRREHWAWQPLRPLTPDPTPPKRGRGENLVDAFVEAKRREAGLRAAPPADRRTLLRRLTFDLTGLPPTPAEIAAFCADERPDAYERVVDRLLASPRFGERWARHWLDLVRYGESRGHESDYTNPNAWQYRDYVIRAFNADVPYHQFVREHLAGDLLESPRLDPVAGFNESVLGTGFWFLGEAVHSPVDVRQDQADRIDNQIDVFGKTFLGLTVACARCHDHKFDAISARDYYALFGILESCGYRLARFDSMVNNRQVAVELAKLRADLAAALRPAGVPSGNRYQIPAASRSQVVIDYAHCRSEDWMPDGEAFGLAPAQPGDLRLGGDLAHPTVQFIEEAAATYDRFWDGLKAAAGTENDPGALGRRFRAGRTLCTPSFLLTTGKLFYRVRGHGQAYASVGGHTMIAGPLHAGLVAELRPGAAFAWVAHDLAAYRGQRVHIEFTAAGDDDFAVACVVQGDRPPEVRLDNGVARPESSKGVQGLAARPSETSGRATQAVRDDGVARPESSKGVQGLAARPESSKGVQGLAARPESSKGVQGLAARPSETSGRATQVVRDAVAAQQQLAARVRKESRLALALSDGDGVDECVFVRGSPKTPGERVPRRFLEALAGPAPLAAYGSGRRELAEQVIDPAHNPLLARVFVNRLWHHLFGRGIVASVDNLGVLGDRPTHPELLDYLAGRLIRDGWSMKRLIHVLVLSATYQMASRPDPDKGLLAHMRLRRLDGEAIRDAMLALSGRLDCRMFGPSVPVHLTEFQDGRGRPESGPLDGAGRRSLYLAVRRNFLSSFLLAFDTPIPFSTVGRRSESNVPAQALILLNDPFVHQQAELWASRLQGTPAERVATMYEEAFARRPEAAELTACLDFLKHQSWAELAHVLFNAKEFRYLE